MHAVKIKSDWSNYYRLISHGHAEMNEMEIYQACSAVANNGTVLDVEKELCSHARKLLEIRRNLKNNDIEKAYESVVNLRSKYLDPMLAGDRFFLLGVIHNRNGNFSLTMKNMKLARAFFSCPELEHRYLRSLMNEKICEENLDSFICGELYVIKQMAHQNNFYDIVANIQKAYSVQLLEHGHYQMAKEQSLRAIENFKFDGCPEDRDIAYSMAAITSLLCGQKDEARRYINHILTNKGKIEAYKSIYNNLLAGIIPKLPGGHPLSRMLWPSAIIKKGTIPGKIFEIIKDGRVSRDEIIRKVWGENTDDVSYVSRLHVAINELRKRYKLNISFDGSYYQID
ncbi:MAG: helix-turn-helix domain-containing protein [Bacteriovoracaceae bacterium]|nr:helix-turn-helix domain-containing protein [Bacteriovoracaceae bacterium]